MRLATAGETLALLAVTSDTMFLRRLTRNRPTYYVNYRYLHVLAMRVQNQNRWACLYRYGNPANILPGACI